MYYVFFICKQFVSIGLYDTWVCRVTKICGHYIEEWQLTVMTCMQCVRTQSHCLTLSLDRLVYSSPSEVPTNKDSPLGFCYNLPSTLFLRNF